ncbi:MAG TPA: Ig-like domain-containing protein [Candidatus Acidoferrales bacterium]|nr:Ig-like domain-containing protein [Candidatus Acidoferrales bacterium]
MSSTKNKLRLAGAFAFLATLALTISCTGFFVNPTVSSITIDPPNPTVSQGFTATLTAAGTDSNGNSITLTGGTSCSGTTVCWSSDTPAVATITTGGLLTGVSAGTSTITAASGTATATTTATVTLGNVTSIVVTPSSITLPVSATATGANCLTAMATAGGTPVNVTASVTWQAADSTIITVANGENPMCPQSTASAGTTTIFAQYTSGTNIITSNSVNVSVGQ